MVTERIQSYEAWFIPTRPVTTNHRRLDGMYNSFWRDMSFCSLTRHCRASESEKYFTANTRLVVKYLHGKTLWWKPGFLGDLWPPCHHNTFRNRDKYSEFKVFPNFIFRCIFTLNIFCLSDLSWQNVSWKKSWLNNTKARHKSEWYGEFFFNTTITRTTKYGPFNI